MRDSYNGYEEGRGFKIGSKAGLIVGMVFGIVLIVIGVIMMRTQNDGIKNGIEVTATVSDWVYKGDDMYSVEYEYIIDGKIYHAVSNSSSNMPALIGSKKTIYVDKNNYNKIVENQSWFFYIFIGLGIAAFVAGIAGFFIKRYRQSQEQTV